MFIDGDAITDQPFAVVLFEPVEEAALRIVIHEDVETRSPYSQKSEGVMIFFLRTGIYITSSKDIQME